MTREGVPGWRQQLSALVHRYAALVDDREFADVAGVFDANGLLMVPDPPRELTPVLAYRGAREILDAVAVVGDLTRTQHAITSESYERTSPTTASGRVGGVARHWWREGERFRELTWHVVYRDSYFRGDITAEVENRGTGGWCIVERRLWIEAVTTADVRRVREGDAG